MMQLYETYDRHVARTSGPATAPACQAPDTLMPFWLPQSRDAAILDMGCGFPYRLWTLHRMGFADLHGIDLRADTIRAARKCMPFGLQLHSGDMFQFLENCSRSFDRILLFHVLEHLSKSDGIQLMSLAAKHLTPGGMAVVEVPNVANLLGIHMQSSDLTHQTPFTEFSLAQLLDMAGFRSVELVCPAPAGWTNGWRRRANRLLHDLLFRITGVGPRPRCVCPAVLMTASL